MRPGQCMGPKPYLALRLSLSRHGTSNYLHTEVRCSVVCLSSWKALTFELQFETKHAEKYKNLTEQESTYEPLLEKLQM